MCARHTRHSRAAFSSSHFPATVCPTIWSSVNVRNNGPMMLIQPRRPGFRSDQPDAPPRAGITEIIGVAGIAPQAGVEHLTLVGRIRRETRSTAHRRWFQTRCRSARSRHQAAPSGPITVRPPSLAQMPKLRRKAGNEQQRRLRQKYCDKSDVLVQLQPFFSIRLAMILV